MCLFLLQTLYCFMLCSFESKELQINEVPQRIIKPNGHTAQMCTLKGRGKYVEPIPGKGKGKDGKGKGKGKGQPTWGPGAYGKGKGKVSAFDDWSGSAGAWAQEQQ